MGNNAELKTNYANLNYYTNTQSITKE